jgi:hypothetical protein
MASTTQKRRTDPKRWNRGNIKRQPSNLDKAMGMLPFGKKAAPAKSSRRGSAGKAAMLMSAAGFAYKNRAKISGMLGKRRGTPHTPQGTPHTP